MQSGWTNEAAELRDRVTRRLGELVTTEAERFAAEMGCTAVEVDDVTIVLAKLLGDARWQLMR
jgi:hypothetical protein